MFIGEAPGYEEDKQGLAFVGAAGQLLTKMIAAMGYTRDDVFIANICKCRPPGNRAPLPEEMQKCLPFLREQIKIIRPKTIALLGGTAIKALLETQAGVNRIQGQWTQYEGIPVMPTFHPSYLLRFEPAKHDAWRALKLVLAHLGKPVPGTAK
jgi:uracil-DNA glycosylase family 4